MRPIYSKEKLWLNSGIRFISVNDKNEDTHMQRDESKNFIDESIPLISDITIQIYGEDPQSSEDEQFVAESNLTDELFKNVFIPEVINIISEYMPFVNGVSNLRVSRYTDSVIMQAYHGRLMSEGLNSIPNAMSEFLANTNYCIKLNKCAFLPIFVGFTGGGFGGGFLGANLNGMDVGIKAIGIVGGCAIGGAVLGIASAGAAVSCVMHGFFNNKARVIAAREKIQRIREQLNEPAPHQERTSEYRHFRI